MTKKLLTAAVLASLPLASMAYQPGDWIIRGGAATVEPDESSSTVKVGGSSIPDSGVGVDTDTQLGLTFTYMFADHLAVELLAATPFKHDVVLQGSGLSDYAPSGTTIASVEHLPPTLSLQYFFMDGSSAWQPYAGIGINYFLVLDEELSSGAKSALGASNLNVDDSVGIAFQLGMDYAIDDKWLVNIAVWNIDIETTATFTTGLEGSPKAKADIDIDPWVYMIGVGYKF